MSIFFFIFTKTIAFHMKKLYAIQNHIIKVRDIQ